MGVVGVALSLSRSRLAWIEGIDGERTVDR